MKQPPNNGRDPSRNHDTTTTIVLILLVGGLLLLITLAALALGGRLSFPQAASPFSNAAISTAPAPTLFIPTVECAAPSLLLGTELVGQRQIDQAGFGTGAGSLTKVASGPTVYSLLPPMRRVRSVQPLDRPARLTLSVRTHGDPMAKLGAIRDEIRAADRDVQKHRSSLALADFFSQGRTPPSAGVT